MNVKVKVERTRDRKWGVYEFTFQGWRQSAVCTQHADAVALRDKRRRETAQPAAKQKRRRRRIGVPPVG